MTKLNDQVRMLGHSVNNLRELIVTQSKGLDEIRHLRERVNNLESKDPDEWKELNKKPYEVIGPGGITLSSDGKGMRISRISLKMGDDALYVPFKVVDRLKQGGCE